MNIYEAAVLAKNKRKCITRNCPEFEHIVIKPTGLSDCCIVISHCIVISQTQKKPRWEPTEDDLIATDWVIADEPKKKVS